MKKISVLFLAMFFIFTLAGCQLLGESDEDIAQSIVDNFDGDLVYLSNAIDEMTLDESFEMTQTLFIEQNFDGTVQVVLDYTSTIRGVRIDTVYLTEFHIFVQTEDDTIELNMFFEESGDRISFYLDISSIIDEIDEEELTEMRTVLDINDDWIRFTFEDNMQNIIEFDLLRALLEEYGLDEIIDSLLEEYGFTLDETVFDDADSQYQKMRSHFEKYTDITYLDSFDSADIDVSKTSDNHIETVIKMNHEMVEAMVEEIYQDFNAYLLDLGEDQLPPYDEQMEFDTLIEMLKDVEPMTMTMLHDPINYESMSIEFDLKDTLNELIYPDYGDETDWTNPVSLETFTMALEIKSFADITLPSDYGDMNRVAEEIAKLVLLEQIEEIVSAYSTYEAGIYTLDEYPYSDDFLKLFNQHTSTIEVTSDAIIIELYYIDNEPVFNEPISYEALQLIEGVDDMSRTAFLNYIGFLDSNSFAITRFVALGISLSQPEMDSYS